MLALSAPSPFVICPRCGKNLTWKLQLRPFQSHTKIKWSGFFATIAVRRRRCSIMLWLKSAWIASPTTRDRPEAKNVDMKATFYHPAALKCLHLQLLELLFPCCDSFRTFKPHSSFSSDGEDDVVMQPPLLREVDDITHFFSSLLGWYLVFYLFILPSFYLLVSVLLYLCICVLCLEENIAL